MSKHYKNATCRAWTHLLSLALVLNGTLLSAQETKDWSKEEKDFIGTGYTTDTVKTASTVVVANYFEYRIKRYSQYQCHEAEYISHIQYKIKDKAALESNSQFSYDNDNRPDMYIIKPSGEWKKVDLANGIASDQKVSFSGLTLTASGNHKVALPELEIGDIIDYRTRGSYFTGHYTRLKATNVMAYTIISSMLMFTPTVLYPTYAHRIKLTPAGPLPSQYLYLKSEYPTLKRKIKIQTDKKTEFFSRSFNGAPEFSSKTDEEQNHIYEFEDGYQKALIPEHFAHENNTEPYVKYGFRTPIHKKRNFAFDNGSEPVTQQEIGWVASKMYSNKMFAKESKYAERHFAYKAKLEGNSLEDKINFIEKYFRFLNVHYSSLSDFEHTIYMARFAKHHRIPFQIIAAMPRNSGGKTQDAITPNELSWGLYLNDDGKQYFLTEFNEHATKNDVYSMLKGVEAILITPNKKAKKVSTETITIPIDAPKENLYSVQTEVSIDKTLSTLICQNEYLISGERKKYFYDAIQSAYAKTLDQRKENNDNSAFISSWFYDEAMQSNLTGGENKRLTKVIEKLNDDYYETYFTADLTNDYPNSGVVFESYKIGNDGRKKKDEEEKSISYSVNFKLENYVNKIGADMLSLDLGRLISAQTDIKERNDRKRNYNIDIDETRQFEASVTVTLPDGYKPLNTDNFVKKVDNEAGSFISTCSVSGNKLTFKVIKTYKALMLDKSKWPLMLEFLDAASEMQTTKLFMSK